MPKKKKIMHKFKMGFISTVDTPAQEGAVNVLMKRADNEDLAKAMFDEVLAGMEIEDKVRTAMDDMWKLETALRTSVYSIVDNPDDHPDTLKSVKESLSQFSSAISSLLTEAVDEVEDETLKRLSSQGESLSMEDCAVIVARVQKAWLEANPDKTDEDLPDVLKSVKEDSMPDPKTPTVEDLQKSMDKKDQELLVAKAFGKLNDAEKAHYATLGEEAQGTFLGMTDEQRVTEVSKATEADPVVFTTDDGIQIRKSADPVVLSLAKQAKENKERGDKLEKANEKAEFEKRAGEEMSSIPGELDTKVALLKAIEGIDNKDAREGALEILKAHEETAKLALDKRGERDGEALEAEDEIEKAAKKYQADHKIESYEVAYTKFLETPEGKDLYKRSTE